MNKIQAMELASGLARLITGMEDELLQNIADYMLAGKLDAESSKWKIRKLAELGRLHQRNIETITAHAKEQRELAELTVKLAAVDALQDAERGFRKAAIAGLVADAPAGSMDKTMGALVGSLMKQAKTDLNIVNTTMLYKARDAAGKAVRSAAQLANKQEFLDSLNKAAGKTVTGTESLTAAVSQCLKEMADKGIPAFVDRAGREWTPEAYVNMCVRATVKNTESKALFERMKDYRTHFIEITSHLGARPKCALDQGRIFDLDNTSGTIEDGNGNTVQYSAWSSSSYGKPDGILGINCGHFAYPFTPGQSPQRYFPKSKEENDKRYKEIQKQRELERAVRASKRECVMLKNGDPDRFRHAAVTLKERSDRLKRYCEEKDLTYMNERTSVLGYGHSEASKVTAAYKKALKNEQLTLDKIAKGDIMEESLREKLIISNINAENADIAENVMTIAENDLSILPQKHRDIIDRTLTSVTITDDTSGYKDSDKSLFLRKDLEEGDTIHEVGHLLYHELKLEDDPRYNQVLRSGIESITYIDDVYRCKTYEKEFWAVRNAKFINPYQGRIYVQNDLLDYSASFDYFQMREYFSEGYRAYFKEPDLLKSKDPQLYEYIRELVDNG